MREVSIPAIIPATLMARRAFYALGRSFVYTNSYKDCHTVKAYRTGNAGDIEIKASIVKLMKDNEYNGITAHLTKRAIIIRIPK
jgi:ribosomal protein L21E